MKHLIFIFVDHFEPREPTQVEAWVREYPKLASRYTDSGGHHPKHTWFYDASESSALDALGTLCRQGLGEIEVHLHHANDTSDGLREKLAMRKRVFAEHGALIDADGRQAFGFIHGKWSLDNSRGPACCGVNDELVVLRDAGCYADFTFPAWGRMQPSMRNCIYYATDDPIQPKSYDTGVPVEVGRPPSGDLMIFCGPGALSGVPTRMAKVPGVRRAADALFGTCAINRDLLPHPHRVERWVRANVHVKGRPDWVFVKVHTHGARPRNFDACFGLAARALYAHLSLRYNDGANWHLHYATAREAYNMVKAAEAGEAGEPEQYRDYILKPRANAG